MKARNQDPTKNYGPKLQPNVKRKTEKPKLQREHYNPQIMTRITLLG